MRTRITFVICLCLLFAGRASAQWVVTTLALWAYYRYAVPELRELLDWKFMRLL